MERLNDVKCDLGWANDEHHKDCICKLAHAAADEIHRLREIIVEMHQPARFADTAREIASWAEPETDE
jgi:hypothetical protein